VPLTADDFIQENSGTTTASTSIAVTLPSGTTLDSTLIVTIYSAQAITAAPAGFVQDYFASGVAPGVMYVYRKSLTPASETSWTWTQSPSGDAAWYVAEMTNVDPADPLESTNGQNVASLSNGGTASTLTTAQTAGLSTVAFAVFGAVRANSGVTVSFGSYTNGFQEVADIASSSTPGLHIAVARKFRDGDTGTFESTATYATSGSAATADTAVVAYRAADASIAAPLDFFAGFEWGTHAGINQPASTRGLLATATAFLGTWGIHYLIQAGSARNGGYGLRLAPAGGALQGSGSWGNQAASASFCFGFNVRVVSATGTVVVGYANTSTLLQLVYDSSTTQFGLRWGTGGTITYQTGTTALNTWVWVDVGAYADSSGRHARWRLETAANTYTAQPDCDTTSGTTSSFNFQVGAGSGTQTASMDIDDLVSSRYYAAYPLGPHTVRLLKVDPAGTPSVSGTSSNFSVFTSNGTLAAWNATNARNAVDEVPPTVSASADGVVQTAVAASDYMEFPMETYACSSSEIIAGVRMMAAMWGGTGSGTGTLGIRGYDGTTETILIDTSVSYDADSLTTASATYPYWQAAIWPSGPGWTQAELDAAALRIGFSTDATPDMGIHAVYLEVATREAPTVRQITAGEADEFTVDLRVNPYNSASVSYLIGSTHATRGATFNYSVSGIPQTAVYVAASSTQEVVTNAASFGDISDLSLEPDAV
jgi:hypothetical protein